MGTFTLTQMDNLFKAKYGPIVQTLALTQGQKNCKKIREKLGVK